MSQQQFQMIHHLEGMTRAERLAADEQAGRMAYALCELGRAAARGALALGRWARAEARLGGTPMRQRRSA